MPSMGLFLGLFAIAFVSGVVVAYFWLRGRGYARKSEYDDTRKQLRQAGREIEEQLRRAEVQIGQLEHIVAQIINREEKILAEVEQLAEACENLKEKNNVLEASVKEQHQWVAERRAQVLGAIQQVVEGTLGLENLIRHHVREAAQETNNDEALRTVGSSFTSLKVWQREHIQEAGDDGEDDTLQAADIAELAELLENLSAGVVRGLCRRAAQ